MDNRALASEGQASPDRKAFFANRVLAFANRVRNLPGLAIYFVGGGAAILLMTTAGAFGTLAIPLATRLAFWSLLIGSNVLLWVLWFAWRVRGPTDWWRAALLGMVVINLPLPAEIGLYGQLLGLPMPVDWTRSWASAAAISLALLLVLVVAIRPAPATTRPDFSKGLLWRGGFRDADAIAAIAAEDHYCRIWRSDGSSSLLHARFGDLVSELETNDGAVIRRGHWVAASSVETIERRGRQWHVSLKDGRSIGVSPSAAADLRARGWL